MFNFQLLVVCYKTWQLQLMSFQILLEFKSCFFLCCDYHVWWWILYCVILVTVLNVIRWMYFVWSEILWCFHWIMSWDYVMWLAIEYPFSSEFVQHWIYLMSEFPSHTHKHTHTLVYFEMYKVTLLNLSHLLLKFLIF